MHTRSHEKWIKKNILNEWCVLCVYVSAWSLFLKAHFEQSKATDDDNNREEEENETNIPKEWSENRSLNVVFSLFLFCFLFLLIWSMHAYMDTLLEVNTIKLVRNSFVERSSFSTVYSILEHKHSQIMIKNKTQQKSDDDSDG